MMVAQATFVVTAGGTGGHLYPAQALTEQLLARGHRMILMTDRRGRVWADRFAGAEIIEIASASLAGGVLSKLRAAFALMRGAFGALSALRKINPAAVIGFGGYASFPGLWAASRLNRPIILHEQNAHLGRANRVFAKQAAALALSFQTTHGITGSPRTEYVGNPVRQSILDLSTQAFEGPGHVGPIELLVFGGSQGASIFADTVPKAIGLLPAKLKSRLHVVQQVRDADMAAAQTAYAETGVSMELATFFENMDARLQKAHLVLSRAGASTVSELMVTGRPSVLVPYPHATDDHQTANAQVLTDAGAAWLVPNAKFDVATCARTLEALLEDPAALQRMSVAARGLAQPSAANALADLAEEIGGVA